MVVETVRIFKLSAFVLTMAAAIAYHAGKEPIYAASDTASSPPAVHASGATVYQQNCALCHGEKMEGIQPAFPTLAGVGRHRNPDQISLLIRQGRGRMPAFGTVQLPQDELTSLLHYLANDATFNAVVAGSSSGDVHASVVDAGGSLFLQNCAFCHGRDAAGGETGPDLTRSKLVSADISGDQIGPVVRNGKPDNKMPKFTFSEAEMSDLVKFIHAQAKLAASRPGGRRGVDVADLQTGNVSAGKEYFNGAGKCSSCHSPTGDLAGIATRYQGLQLEERMLYPRDAKDTLTVTLPSGETVAGRLEYQDEFTIGMRDANGIYRSWPTNAVKYTIDSPVTAHVDQFPKYTDDDIHNLMAYIQTLR